MLCADAPGFHFKDLRISTQPSQAPMGLTCPHASSQADWRALAKPQGEKKKNHRIDVSSICEQGRETRR